MNKTKIENTIIRMLEERGVRKSLCPSEVARKLSPEDWRALMPEIREVADALKREMRIGIFQRNKPIESAQLAVGPIRLKLVKER